MPSPLHPTVPGAADSHRDNHRDVRQHTLAGRLVIATAAAVGACVLIAGCSGSSAGSSVPSSTPASGSSSSPSAANGRAGTRGPAASGEIAAVSGTTMQVQNQQTGQVAVNWTATTTFTHQVSVTVSSIKAGDCVTAIGPSGTSSTATSFTATTVTVTSSTSGCTGGGGNFGGGNFPSGAPSDGNFPSGAGRPSGLPSGVPSGGFPNIGAVAAGSVVSVSGSTIVVAARDFRPGVTTSGSGSSPTTTNKTITIAPTTTLTGDQSTTSASVKVGLCATAQGTADSSGAVTATSVRLTNPVNGACTTGFGGRPGAAVSGGGSGA